MVMTGSQVHNHKLTKMTKEEIQDYDNLYDDTYQRLGQYVPNPKAEHTLNEYTNSEPNLFDQTYASVSEKDIKDDLFDKTNF